MINRDAVEPYFLFSCFHVLIVLLNDEEACRRAKAGCGGLSILS